MVNVFVHLIKYWLVIPLISNYVSCTPHPTLRSNFSFGCQDITAPTAILKRVVPRYQLVTFNLETEAERNKSISDILIYNPWNTWQFDTIVVMADKHPPNKQFVILLNLTSNTLSDEYKFDWKKETDHFFLWNNIPTFYRGHLNEMFQPNDTTVPKEFQTSNTAVRWNTTRTEASVVKLNDEPCIVGGNARQVPVVCYSSANDEWYDKVHLEVKSRKSQAIVHNNVLYMCAVHEQLCRLYNVQSGAKLSSYRIVKHDTGHHKLVVIKNEVYSIGSTGKTKAFTKCKVGGHCELIGKHRFIAIHELLGLILPCESTTFTSSATTFEVVSTQPTTTMKTDNQTKGINDTMVVTNETMVAATDKSITTKTTYSYGKIIKLELEKSIEDETVDLLPSSQKTIKEKCEILANLAGCQNCFISVLRLKKTHVPIKVSRSRTQRQTFSQLEDVIQSFFRANPHTLPLTTGNAKIIGKKSENMDPDTSEEDKRFKTAVAVCVAIIIILVIMLVIVLALWIRNQTNNDAEVREETFEMNEELIEQAAIIKEDKKKSETLSELEAQNVPTEQKEQKEEKEVLKSKTQMTKSTTIQSVSDATSKHGAYTNQATTATTGQSQFTSAASANPYTWVSGKEASMIPTSKIQQKEQSQAQQATEAALQKTNIIYPSTNQPTSDFSSVDE